MIMIIVNYMIDLLIFNWFLLLELLAIRIDYFEMMLNEKFLFFNWFKKFIDLFWLVIIWWFKIMNIVLWCIDIIECLNNEGCRDFFVICL